MEDKLLELTGKLYEEGLEKGRADADKLLAEARTQAGKILEDARAQATKIVFDARKSAAEMSHNAATEVSLASRQAIAALKERIADMVIAKTVSGPVKEAVLDPQFVKEMLLAAGRNWNGASADKVTLSALLPAEWQGKLGKQFEVATAELLRAGIEVGYSDRVAGGFKVGEKGGGYYVSFTDADFDALLAEFLKGRTYTMLFGEQGKSKHTKE